MRKRGIRGWSTGSAARPKSESLKWNVCDGNTGSVSEGRVTVEVQKDFVDLCALLNGNGVEYLIVGGYALAFHGAPAAISGVSWDTAWASKESGKYRARTCGHKEQKYWSPARR